MSSSMFRKKSRANVRHHRAQWNKAISVPQLTTCPNRACGKPIPPHIACPACGQYRGRQVTAPN
ncbi:large subunit ribosomal protein L32 [Kibdelosporangium aridum]|uniref:Large ribosomal subunit protein bL32 n=2 Tax=Kibdelosporangium aridum TaxID=2030 RepID=A0A1Y5WS71_KIBAR|nr:large subunit ribosomal protein L32 [Kibdelosporangium aridum]